MARIVYYRTHHAAEVASRGFPILDPGPFPFVNLVRNFVVGTSVPLDRDADEPGEDVLAIVLPESLLAGHEIATEEWNNLQYERWGFERAVLNDHLADFRVLSHAEVLDAQVGTDGQ